MTTSCGSKQRWHARNSAVISFTALTPVVLAFTVACGDGTGLSGRVIAGRPEIAGLALSAPVAAPVPGGAEKGSAAASASGTVVYVSLAPASVANSRQAVIRALATGDSIATAVVNGGFDPVPIVASVGDTLLIEVVDTEGEVIRAMRVAPERPRPVLVRTSPPPRKRDVPLNSIIVMVFSGPLDEGTVNTNSVKLWRGTSPIAGAVQFADVARLRVEFHPDNPLAGQTDYQLVLSQEIRDVKGVALSSSVTIPFTTAAVTPTSSTKLTFASVSSGYLHTCAVSSSGAGYCWGSNGDGELGNGKPPAQMSTPVLIVGGVTFATVTAGAYHSCGLTAVGAAYCWGANGDGGQLGDGTRANRSSPIPVAGDLRFALLSAGGFHTCGVTAAGDAYCWGANGLGQLGDGTTIDRLTPVRAAGELKFAAVSAGLTHTCGVTVGHAAYCWGANEFPGGSGQLGDGTTAGTSIPTPVAGGLTFAAVSAGGAHTCGVTTAGDGYCWGVNEGGALGDGTTTSQVTPVLIAGGLNFAAVSAGHQHTCGISVAGDAYCWGHNSRGELGTTASDHRIPGLVTGGLRFAALSPGTHYSCGVTTSGVAYCWGANWMFQHGDGTSTDSDSPVSVSGQD